MFAKIARGPCFQHRDSIDNDEKPAFIMKYAFIMKLPWRQQSCWMCLVSVFGLSFFYSRVCSSSFNHGFSITALQFLIFISSFRFNWKIEITFKYCWQDDVEAAKKLKHAISHERRFRVLKYGYQFSSWRHNLYHVLNFVSITSHYCVFCSNESIPYFIIILS